MTGPDRPALAGPAREGPAQHGPPPLMPLHAARAIAWVLLLFFAVYVFLKAFELTSGDPTLPSYRIDFVAIWAAARLTLDGQALAAFDPAALGTAAGLGGGQVGNLFWLYPPALLLLVAPLGALPFWAAWIAFVMVSLVAFALALRVPAHRLPAAFWLMLSAPALIVACLPIGQTGALWAAGIVAAIWQTRRARPAGAGLLLAFLTLKPQLGIPVAVALLAARDWRTVAWAGALSAVLHLGAAALFGFACLGAFLDGLAEAARRVAAGEMPIERMISAYAFFRGTGLDHGSALALQGAASLALLVATARIWSRPGNPDAAAAFLCAAIPVATPYAFYYEMTLGLAAALFLIRSGFGGRPWERLWLLLLWFGPVPPLYAPSLAAVNVVVPPLLAVTAVVALRRGHTAIA